MPSASPSGSGFDALTIDDSSDLGSPLPHNAHIHMPPNFSAFDTVEQIIGLAVEQGQAMLVASNYYDHRIYGQFADRCFAAGIFPGYGLEIITYDQDLGAAGVKTNDHV